MTKEMRPSHRVDVLTDALLHYGKRTTNKIVVLRFLVATRWWICTVSLYTKTDLYTKICSLLKSACCLSGPSATVAIKKWGNCVFRLSPVNFYDDI